MRGIKAINSALRMSNNSLQGVNKSPQLLSAAGRLGSRGLQVLVRNSKNLRIGPVFTIAILSYIESRENCDFDPFDLEDGLLTCRAFPAPVTQRNSGKWDNLIERILDAKRITGNVNGALFNMLSLASHQLEFELGTGSLRPVAQEYTANVTVGQGANERPQINLERDVDIMLADITDGVAATLDRQRVSDLLEESYWIEVKSLGRNSLSAPQWTVASGRTSRHRQFALDCSAKKTSGDKQNQDFRWWLQDWKPRGTSRIQPPSVDPHMKSLNVKLHNIPNQAYRPDYGLRVHDTEICPEVNAKLLTITNKVVDTLTLNFKKATVDAVKANLPPGSYQ